MSFNTIVFGWNRSLPGREPLSGQHFQSFSEYLMAQQRQGVIASFEAVLIEPHGGTFNGFFLIRGEPGKLSNLVGSQEWMQHQARAMHHLDGPAVLRGVSGTALRERMDIWLKEIPH